MLRLEDATGGEILYKGQPVNAFNQKALREYRKKAQIIFQDPYNSINPKQTIFDIVAEPLEVNSVCSSEREKEERRHQGDLGGGPAAGHRVPVPLPPRALRRAAAARLHRRRHGARAGRDRRRRAGRQPRRVHPQRHPQAHGPPEGHPGRHLHLHHPRPLAGLGDQRPHRRDVPGTHRRDRRHRGGRRQSPASLHQGAHQRHPGARPAGQARARHPQGRDAQPGGHPLGLPLPPALPRGDRRVQGDRPGGRAHRRRPLRRLHQASDEASRRGPTCPRSRTESDVRGVREAVSVPFSHDDARVARASGALSLLASSPARHGRRSHRQPPRRAGRDEVIYRIGTTTGLRRLQPAHRLERHHLGQLPAVLRLPDLVQARPGRRLRRRSRSGDELEDVAGRQGVDLHDPVGHELARRHAAHGSRHRLHLQLDPTRPSTGPTSST